MASTPAATPDTLVTLKVNFDGATRRFKLPLRDLGATTLEEKLRGFLDIAPDAECLFERYSDSAASYVVLDATNGSVYKQLYRAAKAKLKLKLRVTTKEELEEADEEEEKKGPKPVTVEDEPEVTEAPVAAETRVPAEVKTEEPLISVASSPVMPPAAVPVPQMVTCTLPVRPISMASADAQLRHSLAMMEVEHRKMERDLEVLEASFAALNRLPPAIVRSSPRSSEAPAPGSPPAPSASEPAPVPPVQRINFAVWCNSCDRTIPGPSHYHCSTCDDGDFDLCQDCVDQGITCYGDDHWLIKRFVKNGIIINSTTERLAPKPKPKPVPQPVVAIAVAPAVQELFGQGFRTCNNCVKELPSSAFVHCNACEDFDLCTACFAKNQHGHHPKHAFVPAVEGTVFGPEVTRYLAPGRSHRHAALCDGCDKDILGVRHKCLDCPDWDYCSDCVQNAGFIHPNHRFVPIYEPLEAWGASFTRVQSRPQHVGICCDGPLCKIDGRAPRYIVGDRFKCAVCHDTDFCANCEASPANTHNKTHPLIKFKSPVRHVSVTTTGEDRNGLPMRAMGDRALRTRASTSSRATETTIASPSNVSTNVQTVVDVQPSFAAATPVKNEGPEQEKEEVEEKTAPVAEKAPSVEDLEAIYIRDSVADGSTMQPDKVFEQTWTLRNEGSVAWPAGCSVKFTGGDYMGHVDSNHPAGIRELVSASESTKCYAALAPGQEFDFTVLLRTPLREGKIISYWRLTTPDGHRFGHRLWCDVNVQAPPKEEVKEVAKEEVKEVAKEEVKEEPKETPAAPAEEAKTEDTASSTSERSQMIFPKLEKESPVSSVHYQTRPETTNIDHIEDDFEECNEDDEWAEDDSEDGFLTDEEYDVLDASDEEYLEEQHQKMLRK